VPVVILSSCLFLAGRCELIESIRARRADPDTFHSIHAKPVTRLTVFNTSVIIGASAPYTFSSEHKRLPK
ncbi:hypothetical protein, partial [Klebsiella pneumoniae]|uniref:hypothetical protein n=1 Tax=Klebsiella pneumoniae TaxID=573 RepID=UPI001D0F1C9E